jgi:DNA-binding protein WhiA
MSFSMRVKDDVARLTFGLTCCQRAELAAFARSLGSVRLGKRRTLVMTTELPVVARRIFLLLKNLGWSRLVAMRRSSRPRHRRLFAVQVGLEQQNHNLLRELGFIDSDMRFRDFLEPSVLAKDCCKKAFLRGCFLGCGFIVAPSG